MDRHEEKATGERFNAKRGWQYSLLGLLVVTTIVSICLAFGVNYPRIALALLAVGLMQVGAMYWIEWLMRRRGGRTVKQATALVRAILGTAFLIAAWGMLQVPLIASVNNPLPTVLAYLMGSVGLLCWILAWRRWP